MRGVGELLREARRRRVFRAAAIYVVAAWGALQVADLAFESWGLSARALRYFWLGAFACFPLALVFGWRYDVTPQGIIRTSAGRTEDRDRLRLGPADYAVLAALGLVGLTVAGGALMRAVQSEFPAAEEPPTRAPADGRMAIAVLPFVNMSASADNEYFSDGLTEEILNVLANLVELKVAARTSSFYYKDRNVPIEEVADRLGVDVVLEGSVRRQREEVRVTAQLIDGRTGFHLWSRNYDRRLEDVFAIQSDIARQVVAALDVVLSERSEARIDRPYTDNVEAYETYLRARDFLRRARSPANLEAAAARFQRAIDLDPAFARAYAGLCDTRLIQYEIDRATALFEQAEAACHRALTLAADAPSVYVALGNLHRYAGQADIARREFLRALDLLPGSVDAVLGLAETLAAQGDARAAERKYLEAIALDPSYGNAYQDFGNFLYRAGRYAEAAASYREVIRLRPDNSHAWNNLGAAHFLDGDFAEAALAYERSLELEPTKGATMNTGTMHYFAGDFERAVAMYRRALEISPEDEILWSNLADALSHLPRPEEAGRAYERAASLASERLKVNPGEAETGALLAYVLARAGRPERVPDLLAEALRRGGGNYYVHYYAAQAWLALDERERALGHLERALALGYPAALVRADPAFAVLADDPAFRALFDGT